MVDNEIEVYGIPCDISCKCNQYSSMMDLNKMIVELN